MIGLGLYGAANFVLLGLAGRDLGPAAYAPFSVAWTTVNAIGLGLFIPVEQEVSRLAAARHAAGQAPPRLTHVLRYFAAASAAILLVCLVAQGWIAGAIFNGQRSLVWYTAAAIIAIGVQYLARGVLAGYGQFLRYGFVFAIDAVVRVVIAVVIFLTGSGTVDTYGWAIVVSPLVSVVLTVSVAALRWLRDHPTVTEDTPLAPLVSTTIASQLLSNAGPLVIAYLATATEQDAAGNFVSAVTIGRIPLFLFAAVQAVFLPTLAGLVARGAKTEFNRTVRLALIATTVLGLAGVLGVAILGPWAMGLIYGPKFSIGLLDLVLIAVSGAAFMIALATAQALLAHRHDIWVLVGWVAGLIATVACLWLPLGLTTKAATALVGGSVVSAAVLGLFLTRTVRSWIPEPTTVGIESSDDAG